MILSLAMGLYKGSIFFFYHITFTLLFKYHLGYGRGAVGNWTGHVIMKLFPSGETIISLEYPYKKFIPPVLVQVSF